MAEALRLTAAEIVFLLSTLDAEAASKAPVLFGFADSERTDAVAVSGLGSLVLRGLASADAERVQLTPDVAAIGAGLVHATDVVQIGLLAKGRSDAAIMFCTPSTRFLVTPLRHRCFQVTGLDAAKPMIEPLLHLTREFLTEEQPGVVSVVFGAAATPEQAKALHSVIVSADSQGRWSLARAGVQGERTGLTEQEALDHLKMNVGEILAASTGAPPG